MTRPVQAEVFVIWRNADLLELTGPCGADAWYLELGETDHPVEVVDRVVTDVLGAPRLVHSTSWRQRPGGLVLTFMVVIGPELVGAMPSVPVARSVLARSQARAAPAAISRSQVLEHRLRTSPGWPSTMPPSPTNWTTNGGTCWPNTFPSPSATLADWRSRWPNPNRHLNPRALTSRSAAPADGRQSAPRRS